MIIIADHGRFSQDGQATHGTGSEINTFLQRRGIEYVFIRHPLHGGLPTLAERFNKKKAKRGFYGLKNLPFILRIIQEQFISFYFIFKTKKTINLFIGIDSLNAFSGILAQKLGKVKKTVFYTADYAHQRFKNPIINWVYHWFDRFAIKNVNQVWNVSTRITKQREKQRVPKEKNFFVPNAPNFRRTKRLSYSKINKHDLVIVSSSTQALDFPLIIKVVKNLSQRYQDLRMLIIGSDSQEEKLKRLVLKQRLSDKILFLGRKPHPQVLEILSQSAVGLAPYTRNRPWTEFGDSMKVREYLACGLPVIMTNVPSTADDVEKAEVGYIIRLKEREFEKAINKLFSDENLYLKMRQNAISMAKACDFEIIIERILRRLF